MSLTLDTADMEARLEERIAQRVVREVARLLGASAGAPVDRWLSLKDVAERVRRSKRTVNDMAKRGEFPRHATVLKGAKLWRESDVEGWRKAREAGQA